MKALILSVAMVSVMGLSGNAMAGEAARSDQNQTWQRQVIRVGHNQKMRRVQFVRVVADTPAQIASDATVEQRSFRPATHRKYRAPLFSR